MEQVAHHAHCSFSILGEYERAERVPREAALVRDLAGVLGVPPGDLVGQWNRAVAARAVEGKESAPCVATPVVSRLGSWRPARSALEFCTRHPWVGRQLLLVAWTTMVVVTTIELSD